MADKDSKKGIVKSNSKGAGYSYASLGDIANQDYKIPKMRVAVIDGMQFIEYLDPDTNEWQNGGQIITEGLENKRMNVAQAYGAALTYARRYASMMALGLACDDDKKLETTRQTAPDATDATVNQNGHDYPKSQEPATDKQIKTIWAIVNANSGKDQADSYIKSIGADRGKLTKDKASLVIEALKNAEAKKQEIANMDIEKPITEEDLKKAENATN